MKRTCRRNRRLPEVVRTAYQTPREGTIEKLTSKQRAELRSQAHSLKPVQHIGKDGVTEAVLQSIDEAFNTRELVKIRVLEGAPGSPREMADEVVAARPDTQIVQTIGGVAVLYRKQEEERSAKGDGGRLT